MFTYLALFTFIIFASAFYYVINKSLSDVYSKDTDIEFTSDDVEDDVLEDKPQDMKEYLASLEKQLKGRSTRKSVYSDTAHSTDSIEETNTPYNYKEQYRSEFDDNYFYNEYDSDNTSLFEVTSYVYLSEVLDVFDDHYDTLSEIESFDSLANTDSDFDSGFDSMDLCSISDF